MRRRHYVLGLILRQAGDMAGAKSELQEANRIQPNNPMTLQALAEVYRDSHDFDTAMEYADQAAAAERQQSDRPLPERHHRSGQQGLRQGLDEI